VREKVSFLTETRPAVPAAPVNADESVGDGEPTPATSTPPAPEPSATEPSAPRRAGWWSRRFGGGE
jgi:ribonuclease E